MVKAKAKVTAIILSLTIPLLIWGPFFPDLIVSLSSLFFLIYVFKNKLFFFVSKKPLIIFFIFSLYCVLISIIASENILLSFESSLFYFRIGVFASLVWYLIEQDKKILNYFYFALVACFSVLVVDGYIQYFLGHNIIGLPKSELRVSSFFGDELIMGSYVSRLYPLAFALFIIRKKKKFESYFVIFLFILVSGLVYISGERSALLFHALSLMIIAILVKKYSKIRMVIFFGSVIFIATLGITNDELINRFFKSPIETMGINKESKIKYIFTKQHDSFIRTAFNMFKDKPIFGHGPKMFRVICKDKKYAEGVNPCMTHPHNFYVQLLAETGIIGFMFLFSVLIYVINCLIKQVKTIIFKQKRYLTDYQVCLLACIFITVFPFTPNGNFFHNWLIIVYSLPVGFYIHSFYGKNKDEINKN